MPHIIVRGLALSVAVAFAVTGCGGDGSAGEAAESVPVQADANVTADVNADVDITGPVSAEPGENATMSVAELCDPVEDAVAAWAGGSLTSEHNPIYVEAAEPILVCKWVVDDVERSIRVDYVGVPDSFMLNLVEGKQDRTDVVAPNFHDKNSFYVIAPNGWGIVVSNLGAERSEDLDPMVVIAKAALDQIGF